MREASKHGDPGSLYRQEFFRRAAGSVLRPGGLELTVHGLDLCGLLAAAEPDWPGARRALLPGLAVVDVGCGSGVTLDFLADLGFRALGVEPDPALRAERAERKGPPGGQPPVLSGQAEALPLPDGAMDAVLCECVLSLVQDKALALAELRRVLKPGGVLLWTDIYRKIAPDGRKRAMSAPSGHCGQGMSSLEEMRVLLERHDFTILAQEEHSRSLRELAGQMLFNGNGADLARWLGTACLAGRDIGYVLFAARRSEA